MGVLHNVEVLVELLMGHVRVAVNALLVFVGGIRVVRNNLLHSLGKDLFAICLSASQECATGSGSRTILVLLNKLLVHVVNVSFLKGLLSMENTFKELVDVGKSERCEQEADDSLRG